ncbi:DUF4328 domain-containing protein [Pseudonocardia sp. TRM90224]|uniref:DUF4328 domain-containing protein n=1 Tax=Pseudonocardia sp. TRM90224 TaxID=2812678 RepID=UPI001E46412A|nr:DUF4328 domain-containing protein [Pseudonocardia sp. TRM90224]
MIGWNTAWGSGAFAHFVTGLFDTARTPLELDAATAAWTVSAISYIAAAWLVGLGLHVVAGVAVIVWLRRARANAEQLYPAGHFRYGAGWAIGSWFVPIMNLVVPFKIVGEVWTASRPGLGLEAAELSRQPTDPRVGWWWACWLGSWAVSWISARVPGSPAALGLLSTVSALLEIGAAVLLIVIVRRISR